MGFLLIFEEYSHSKIVLDFYAKKIIDGIFDENDIDLEYMLHEQFNSFDELIKVGINNYMINFISSYDIMLANYLCTNIIYKSLKLLKDYPNLLKARILILKIKLILKKKKKI